MTQFRDLEGVKGNGKLDAFRVDWHIISPDPDNDLRDLTTPENRAHIERLKDSVEAEGVRDPLQVRKDKSDKIFATDGRCRLTALAELEAEGRPTPKTVLVLPEPDGTDRAKRTLNMIGAGIDRKNLNRFEIARGIKRALAFGYTEEQVCTEMRWKSKATISHYLDDLAMPADLQAAVKQGKVSATVARKLEAEQPGLAAKLIADAADEQRRLGKRHRATPKAIQKATGKTDKLPLPARQPRGVEREPLPPQPETVAATPAQSEPHPTLVETIRAATADEPLPVPPAPAGTPQRQAVKNMIDALRPFARYADMNDLNERADDDVIEVPVGDIKRAWLVYTSVTGGESLS